MADSNSLTTPTQMMTSREIADLVESRHDSVKRAIERLIERGVITSPPLVEKADTGGRPVSEYLFLGDKGKRDSIVVVAQLSPEFTARLVDRWQELEARLAAPRLPTHLETARMLVLSLERAEIAEAKLAEAQPAIAFHDAVSVHEGDETLIRVAAKTLIGGTGAEKKLVQWLLDNKWLAKTGGGREALKSAIDAGYMRQRLDVVNGRPYNVAVITGKGMASLWHLRERGELFPAGVPKYLLLPEAKD